MDGGSVGFGMLFDPVEATALLLNASWSVLFTFVQPLNQGTLLLQSHF